LLTIVCKTSFLQYIWALKWPLRDTCNCHDNLITSTPPMGFTSTVCYSLFNPFPSITISVKFHHLNVKKILLAKKALSQEAHYQGLVPDIDLISSI
jgi:hypothetical protein